LRFLRAGGTLIVFLDFVPLDATGATGNHASATPSTHTLLSAETSALAQGPCLNHRSPTTLKVTNSSGSIRRSFRPSLDVAALHRIICALRPVRGMWHCPADTGFFYHLGFFTKKRQRLEFTVRASACQWIYAGLLGPEAIPDSCPHPLCPRYTVPMCPRSCLGGGCF